MKKILVALAIAAFASTSFAAVSGSKHDFNASTGATGYSTGQPSRCIYCHVPHNAQSWANTALWALPSTNMTALTFYTATTTIDVRESQTCLSCHADGAVGTSQLNKQIVASAVLGPDFRNDHPIGSDAYFKPGTTRGIVNGAITLGYSSFAVGGDYWVECAVCHNPHNSNVMPGRKLLSIPNGNAAGDFCGACHTR